MASPTSRQHFTSVARTFFVGLLVVAPVVAIAVLFATSLLTSLVIVAGAILVVSIVNRLTAAKGDARPPGDIAGDRFPRRPLPFHPSAALKREPPKS